MAYNEKGEWIGYTEEDTKFDRLLAAVEAKMNLDCPDSYQVRGIKEEDEEEIEKNP